MEEESRLREIEAAAACSVAVAGEGPLLGGPVSSPPLHHHQQQHPSQPQHYKNLLLLLPWLRVLRGGGGEGEEEKQHQHRTINTTEASSSSSSLDDSTRLDCEEEEGEEGNPDDDDDDDEALMLRTNDDAGKTEEEEDESLYFETPDDPTEHHNTGEWLLEDNGGDNETEESFILENDNDDDEQEEEEEGTSKEQEPISVFALESDNPNQPASVADAEISSNGEMRLDDDDPSMAFVDRMDLADAYDDDDDDDDTVAVWDTDAGEAPSSHHHQQQGWSSSSSSSSSRIDRSFADGPDSDDPSLFVPTPDDDDDDGPPLLKQQPTANTAKNPAEDQDEKNAISGLDDEKSVDGDTAIPTTIDPETRRILLQELQYQHHEVNVLKPAIAQTLATHKLHRPNEGIPRHWLLQQQQPTTTSVDILSAKRSTILKVVLGGITSTSIAVLALVLLQEKNINSVNSSSGSSFTQSIMSSTHRQHVVSRAALDATTAMGDSSLSPSGPKETFDDRNDVEKNSTQAAASTLAEEQQTLRRQRDDDHHHHHAHSIPPGTRPLDDGENLDVTWLDKLISACARNIRSFFQAAI